MAEVAKVLTPKSECEADNPEQCKFHGADYIQSAVAQLLNAEGLKGDVSVEKADKPHTFTVSYTSSNYDEQSKASDLITIFIGSRGGTDFDRLRRGNKFLFTFTLPKDNDAGRKDKFGADSDFADKSIEEGEQKSKDAKKDEGEYAPPTREELLKLAHNIHSGIYTCGQYYLACRMLKGIWDVDSMDTESSIHKLQKEMFVPVMADALAKLPTKEFEYILKYGRNFDADYRNLPNVRNAAIQGLDNWIREEMKRLAAEGRPYPKVEPRNSVSDSSHQQSIAKYWDYFSKGKHGLLARVKEYTGLTPAKGGKELLQMALFAALRIQPDDAFDEDTGVLNMWMKSYVSDKASQWLRYSPNALRYTVQQMEEKHQQKARDLAQATADKARLAKCKDNPEELAKFRDELVERIRSRIPQSLSEDSRTAFEHAPFEVAMALEQANFSVKALGKNSQHGSCNGSNARIGKLQYSNNAITIEHEAGHAALNALLKREGLGREMMRNHKKFHDILETCREEAKAYADSLLGAGWEGTTMFRNGKKNYRGLEVSFYLKLYNHLYGHSGEGATRADLIPKEHYGDYKRATMVSDMMCASYQGQYFQGHSTSYFRHFDMQVHEVVADATAMMCQADATALKVFPKTVALVAKEIYGIDNYTLNGKQEKAKA